MSAPSAPPSPTKCDIIRDYASANMCGLCVTNSDGSQRAAPSSCGDIPRAVCGIPAAANAKMYILGQTFFAKNTSVNTDEINIYKKIISDCDTGLTAAYGFGDISWPDFQNCLWNTNGSPGGTNQNKYFTREDILELGMNPSHPVGGTAAAGKLWPAATSPLPVSVDYIANPDLFAIMLIILLVCIAGVLIYLRLRLRTAPQTRPLRTAPQTRPLRTAPQTRLSRSHWAQQSISPRHRTDSDAMST